MAVLIIEHSDTSGSGRLGETLRDYGHRLDVLQVHQGDSLPPDLDNIDAIVTCGGQPSANDDSLNWLEPEMHLLREAHELSLPIVGLCLGNQLLARALGGSVEEMSSGIEFGWHEVQLNPVGREDVLHAGVAWKSLQFHFHRDCVAELPPGARLLASSEKCRVQSWALGMRTYGFQYHPEASVQTVERWMQSYPEALEEAGTNVDQVREQTEKNYPTFERLSRRLFESVALFLMPLDRRYHGLAKELHH